MLQMCVVASRSTKGRCVALPLQRQAQLDRVTKEASHRYVTLHRTQMGIGASAKAVALRRVAMQACRNACKRKQLAYVYAGLADERDVSTVLLVLRPRAVESVV